MWETSSWVVEGFLTHPVHIYSSTLRLQYSIAALSLFQASYVNSHNNNRRLDESAWKSCKQAKLLLLPALYYGNTFLLSYQLVFCKFSLYSFLPFSSKNWINIHPWALPKYRQTDRQTRMRDEACFGFSSVCYAMAYKHFPYPWRISLAKL